MSKFSSRKSGRASQKALLTIFFTTFKMKEVSLLIGGQAGDGIKQAGNAIARFFNRLGYYAFVYEDYPSLIRGGHNFAVIRVCEKKILAHKSRISVLVALNQETIEKHANSLTEDGIVIFDSSCCSFEGENALAIPMSEIAKSENLPLIVRNVIALGALAALFGAEFSIIEDVIKSTLKKKVEENIKVAKKGYEEIEKFGKKGIFKLNVLGNEKKYLLTGNEATALGLVKGGLKLYIAYPMTPASSILHYLAAHEDELGIRAVHPENEIAVIGMAQGAAYAGVRTAVGTSGGGFALMVEHLSLSGQAEIPLVAILSQRPAPATGVPTYTMQGDLFFAMFAGHGEFPRIVLAPGDAEEAYLLSAKAMNLAWKFQVPVILLLDKHLSESTFACEIKDFSVSVEEPLLWNGEGEYKRYLQTENGISPLAFPGTKNAVVKINSYEHDEFGITVEDAELVKKGFEKRLRKMHTIENYVANEEADAVKVYGNEESNTALVFWGSTKGSAVEVAENLGIKAVQPVFLYPLPEEKLKAELNSCEKVIVAETNSTGQLAQWLKWHGIKVSEVILRYDARPFTVDELEEKVKSLL